jgi:hypothetical protein
LLAEVAAAVAVVSEAALVYVARLRNLIISFAMIALQIILTFALIITIKRLGYPELYQAAGPAIALALSLGISSLIKSRLAAHVLGASVSVWRWALPIAGAVAILIGQIIIRLPEWAELAIGIPAILAAYGWMIWSFGFGEADRVLFRKDLSSPSARD